MEKRKGKKNQMNPKNRGLRSSGGMDGGWEGWGGEWSIAPQGTGRGKARGSPGQKSGGGSKKHHKGEERGGKKTQRGGKMRCEAPAWSSAALWLSKEKTSAFPLSVC